MNASAAFQVDSGKVFKEDVDMVPTIIDKSLSYMPWGGDNMMPYNILKLIEDDETLSTCQQFNAEVCYGSGLKYDTEACTATVKQLIRWHLQEGFSVIPGSSNPRHIQENIEVFDFSLSNHEMFRIHQLDKEKRYFNMPYEDQKKWFMQWNPTD